MKLVFDLESNGLHDATKIHCIVAKDVDTGKVYQFYNEPIYVPFNQCSIDYCDGTIEDGINLLAKADQIVGHNIIDFDIRLIDKLYSTKLSIHKCFDTQVISYLINPFSPKHSLGYYAKQFGKFKPELEDFNTFSKQTLIRCREDVEINYLLYLQQQKELDSYDYSRAISLENQFRYICSEQEKYGWQIDYNKVVLHYRRLKRIRYQLLRLLRRDDNNFFRKAGVCSDPFKKDGSLTKAALDWYNSLDNKGFDIVGPFHKLEITKFNPSSTPQRQRMLERNAWVPTQFEMRKNAKGEVEEKPIISYDSVKGKPLLEKLEKYLRITHRVGVLKGLIKGRDKHRRIHPSYVTNGTVTGRVQHRAPLANVPNGDSFYGPELRSCFVAKEGYKLVGMDFSSLENKLIGHYTYRYDNGSYAARLDSEDSHITTAKIIQKYIMQDKDLKKDIRPIAKTLNYAISYGAQIKKAAGTLNCDVKTAAIIWNEWWDDKPGLKQLKEELLYSVRTNGYIAGIDGRKLLIRSQHSILNMFIQSAGAIVTKFTYVVLYHKMKQHNIDGFFVSNYHDEINAEIAEKDVDKYKQLVLESIEEVNKYFNFYIPMVGDIKVGNNWSEIH